MQIKELIEKFYLGSLTDDEMILLLNYLKEKEPQHEILSYYQGVWDKSSEPDVMIDSKSIYDKVVSAVGVSPVGLKAVTESPDRVRFQRLYQDIYAVCRCFCCRVRDFLADSVHFYKENGNFTHGSEKTGYKG